MILRSLLCCILGLDCFTDLFGGAMRISTPESWLDTESFMDLVRRPVPDNQEVFVAPPGGGAKKDSRPLTLFIDILEAAIEHCPDPENMPLFHAGELLRRDERTSEADSLAHEGTAVVDVKQLQVLGEGATAVVARFKSCDLEVCVVRLHLQTTDIVLSLHGRQSEPESQCPELGVLASSLEVLDWGLFGG